MMDEGLILEPRDLNIGDILLYRWREQDAVSRRIYQKTGSHYTHTAIYLGDDLVAESEMPVGVVRNSLKETLKESLYVGVLRSQLGFDAKRCAKLNKFIADTVENRVPFHRHSLVNFEVDSVAFFDNQIEIISQNYGNTNSAEELAQQAYFCSGFLVACFQAVGIIGETAQVAYKPSAFSPAHLYRDATFGWLRGFLVSAGESVPADDPLLLEATRW